MASETIEIVATRSSDGEVVGSMTIQVDTVETIEITAGN